MRGFNFESKSNPFYFKFFSLFYASHIAVPLPIVAELNKEGSMSELIQIKQLDTVAEISLNRPEAYNAFNYELVSQLANQLETAILWQL